MPKCIIDGKEYEFTPGEMVIQIADRNGIDIPRFCYHPAMSVVAQCRMCSVDIAKQPRLQMACAFPAADGMIINTKSDKVKKTRASVMEFLLINHPLDCPICDEAGDCTLQDYSFAYGEADSRYHEQKRTYVDVDMGPVIKKNMNRCIHCTRCVRFCDEIAGYREMVSLKRGNSTEITTVDAEPLKTEYAGNLADICPTGSLTLKDFRFKKRSWMLSKTPSICEGCSQGCNIEVHHERGVIYRVVPRENMEINKYWMCDEGRFLFHYVHNSSRITEPAVRAGAELQFTDWAGGISAAKDKVRGRIAVLAGTDLTLEEMKAIQEFVSADDAVVFHFGGLAKASDDNAEDKLLRRTSKTSNLHGAEKIGLKTWDGRGKFDSAIVFRGGRAALPADLKKAVTGAIVGLGVFNKEMVAGFDVVLPGCSAMEKSGTVVNWQGKEQRLTAAIKPLGQSRELSDIFGLWG